MHADVTHKLLHGVVLQVTVAAVHLESLVADLSGYRGTKNDDRIMTLIIATATLEQQNTSVAICTQDMFFSKRQIYFQHLWVIVGC